MRALITGITGQDGSYLAELLLEKGYEVHGLVRRSSFESKFRIEHIKKDITFWYGSLENYASIYRAVTISKPDECYHLAAQSFVAISFKDEFSTMSTNINGTHYVLSAINDLVPRCKFYFAASSEMFGNASESPQNENTKFNPASGYGISKVTGFNLTKYYRDTYRMWACSGICFNHESPRRGKEFVTRKITSFVAKVAHGNSMDKLYLGNIAARRDWGHARDYVKAMWMMLQKDKPKDYIISSGRSHSVEDFAVFAFSHVGSDFKDYVKISDSYFRPNEVYDLVGDSRKIRAELGWNYDKPVKRLVELAEEMVDADIECLS